jgi:hypothetical protein
MKMKIVKVYRMDPARFPQERKTILKLYWGTAFFMVIGTLVFITLSNLPLSSLWWLPIILGLVLYYMSNAVRRAQRNFDEYTLEWDGEMVKQNTPGMPELVLRVNEITSLEITRLGLQLSTRTHRNVLTIPADIAEADLAELKAELEGSISSAPIPD